MNLDKTPPSFDAPLCDGSLDILQMVEHHRLKNPSFPLFQFVQSNGQLRTISWKEGTDAFDNVTLFIMKNVKPNSSNAPGVGDRPHIVGILANLDSVTYSSLVVGTMKAGFTPFPISTRNSADGVAHLLAATKCQVLITSDDGVTQRLKDASCASFRMANPGAADINIVSAPTFQELFTKEKELIPAPKRPVNSQLSTPAVIIHSSGTISFPKPITLTYKMLFEHANLVRLEGDLRGQVISIHAMPMYHLMGLKAIVYATVLGVTLSVFSPKRLPTIPTPDLVLSAAAATRSSLIFCAPSFLESWATSRENIEILKRFAAIMFGGGPLETGVGNYLAGQGVSLVPMLGLTEVGTITSLFPTHTRTEGWEWFSLSPSIDFEFIHERGDKEIYRFIVKQNLFKTPAVINTAINGIPAYDTGDLFLRHPTNHQLWKIYGRADEQIMHSTGTNPVPIEAFLNASPFIAHALVIGRAKLQPGVIIQPSPNYVFDSTDTIKAKNYIDLIWDQVQEVNRRSPQHSRIFREMILIANLDKPFEYTGKGSIRRHASMVKYRHEIEALYGAFDANENTNSRTDHDRGQAPNLDAIILFVRGIVASVLGHGISDDEDIFQAGADSLCALSIRNSITRGLNQSHMISQRSIQTLPSDLLYFLPSVSKISIFIYGASYVDRAVVDDTFTQEITPESVNDDNLVASHNPAGVDERWQAIMESKETVVEVVRGHGEVPLIILHGSPGTNGPLRPMLNAPFAIWGVQVTDDAPQDSLVDLASFYRRKIKEKRPRGPYRLASYSGSCVILIELALLFERDGDEIVQMVMLDHFPTLFIEQVDIDKVDINNPEWWNPHVRRSLEGILVLFANTQGIMAAQAKTRVKELRDALDGLPGTPSSLQLIERSTSLMRMSLGYLLSNQFTEEVGEGPHAGRRRWSPDLFRQLVTGIKAKLTVYIATGGIRRILPPEKKGRLHSEFGARVFVPDATVMEFEGGHLDFLSNTNLWDNLQKYN